MVPPKVFRKAPLLKAVTPSTITKILSDTMEILSNILNARLIFVATSTVLLVGDIFVIYGTVESIFVVVNDQARLLVLALKSAP